MREEHDPTEAQATQRDVDGRAPRSQSTSDGRGEEAEEEGACTTEGGTCKGGSEDAKEDAARR